MLRDKRNIDEDATIEVSKKQKHNESKDSVNFNTFIEVYKSLHGPLKLTKFNLTVIEGYYEIFETLISVEKAVYRVANFGSPNNRKSSAFNFLMTGSHDFPLPTSGRTDVEGETLKPIRCRYTTSNSLVIRKNDDSDVLKEFKDINKPAVLDFIREKMKEDDVDELTIELPSCEFKEQYEKFENFEFLDLIGMSDSNYETELKKDKFIKLNRTAVEKEHIDAVFLFHSERKKMPRKIIEQLWMTGIFSDLSERRPPKLVNAIKIMKNRDWSNKQELEDIFRGFEKNSSITKLEMQKTVCELFNFADIPDSPEYNELREHMESLPTCDKNLEIENKAESVLEIISRAASVCILDMGGNELEAYEAEYQESFRTTFESIKEDITSFKKEHLFNEARDYMLPICEELLKKIQVFQNSKSIYKDSNKTYLQMKDYMQKKEKNNRLLKSAKKEVGALCNKFFTDRLLNFDDSEENDYGESLDHDANENVQAVNNKKRIKEMFSILLFQIAKVHTQLQTDTSEEIKKIYARSNSSAPRTEVIVASKMIYYLVKSHQSNIIDFMLQNQVIDRHDLISPQIDEIKTKLNEILEESFYQGFFIEIPDQLKNDFNENINQDIEKLKRIKSYIIENKTEKKVSSNQPNYFPKPILFQTKGSNKLPGSNEPVELEDIKKYFKFNHSSNANQLDSLLNEGKAKSQLKMDPIECEQTNHVQFHIERESQTILAEYNGNFIQKKIETLHKGINNFEKDKTSKSLYPIFISSRLRRNKDQGYIDVNIIAKDLLADDLEKGKFLIFLFIESGDEKNRDSFNKEIDYYKSLKQKNCPCNNDEDCPIVLCYLPERDLGIGRKRKIMMMFAEHLMLRRWYFLDDDINSFYEYDRLGNREYNKNKHSTFKALHFMKVVLEDSISNDEQIRHIDKQKTKEWKNNIRKIECALFGRLYTILDDDILKESKNETLEIINKLLNGHPDNLTLIEIKNHLLNDNSKIVGQVALWNKLSYYSEDYRNRLRGEKPNKTHIVSKKRYQVVLYNLDAIKGIHPVSDKVLFESTLNYEERKKLVTSAKSQSFKDGPVCEAARSGYKCSDKAHVLYQILNGVSGFLLYYFSFDTFRCPSKVDEEDNEA